MSGPRHEERFYRRWTAPAGLATFQVTLRESDLFIAAESDLAREALSALEAVRGELERYIAGHPEFGTSLEPLAVKARAPQVVRRMAKAASLCEVGPMAGVAGAIAEEVGRALLGRTRETIVENGGDIFALLKRPLRVALYAGEEKPLIPVELRPCPDGAGIASSSAAIGPSLSLGKAEVATVIAENAALADAAATALCNRVRTPKDLKEAVKWAVGVAGVTGAAAVFGDETALGGEGFRLVPE